MNPALAAMFPNASQSCRDANPGAPASLTKPAKENDSGAILRIPRRQRGAPNKTESEFGLYLEALKRRGEIRDYLFHPFSLPWGLDPETGKPMRYTPDWMVTPNSGMERRRLIEVKGPHIHYKQQAIARFKGARSYWPEFAFELHQKTKSGWKRIH